MAQKHRPQAVETETDTLLTVQSSLQTVKTLLVTGLDCVAYLRSLFTDDHFEDHKLTAPRAPLGGDSHHSKHFNKDKSKDKEATVRVKRMQRGYSLAGDKYLDWIEVGATDALEKGYLQQLVLAIYLDPSEPNNIIECYSFSFTYHEQADGSLKPEMIVRNQLSGLVLNDSKPKAKHKNTKLGQGEASRQVQQLIKALIANTQALNELPRRRFLTVRLYYTESTPDDYEPPHFKPLEGSKTGFETTTSRVDEFPDVTNLGSLQTGYHGVTVQVLSIAPLLEIKYDENISLDECLDRNQRDASTRRVLWDANDLLKSSSHENESKPLGVLTFTEENKIEQVVPIEEITRAAGDDMSRVRRQVGLEDIDEDEELVFANSDIPRRLLGPDNEILRQQLVDEDPTMERSESFIPTQIDPIHSRLHLVPHAEEMEVNTEMDGEGESDHLRTSNVPHTIQTRVATEFTKWANENDAISTQCDCGDGLEEIGMILCTGCENWKHLWCYGFSSENDSNIPTNNTFYCYPCRVVCTPQESLLNPERVNQIREALNALEGLALLRRAIQQMWLMDTPIDSLGKSLPADTQTLAQLKKRLQAEGFLINNAPPAKGKGHRKVVWKLNKSPEMEQHKNELFFTPGEGAEKEHVEVLSQNILRNQSIELVGKEKSHTHEYHAESKPRRSKRRQANDESDELYIDESDEETNQVANRKRFKASESGNVEV